MIQARELTKRYGPVTAVDGLTFDVRPGRVTGFLGPNGAGKSTTMRMFLGLNAPSAGTATLNGRAFGRIRAPLQAVVALVGIGLGTVIRHTAGAVTALVGGLFVAPTVVSVLPANWAHDIGRYLLANAGDRLWSINPGQPLMSVPFAFMLCAGYVAAALAAAFYLIRRRDV